MKIGFIGAGNMGSSMINGMIISNYIAPNNINIYDVDTSKLLLLKKKYDINIESTEKDIFIRSDIIILAVKPDITLHILNKIKNQISNKNIVLSIAAGVSINEIEDIIGKDKKVVRAMPNTPAAVLEGMTAVSFNQNIIDEEKIEIFQMLNSFGKSIEIEEKLIHVYTGISGSLPAYVYLFIEGLADGGVLEGMPREKTYKIISQTVLGAAKMLLETGKHPGQLKDEVTSPGGTTIEALNILENNKFRGILMEAVRKCTEKSRKIMKKK